MTPPSGVRVPGAASWAAGAAAAGFLAFVGLFGRFPFSDDVAYKCAGYHWARSGSFAAPEMTGLLDVDPPVETVWAAYPPLYTFLFGLAVKGFGFGWRTCVLYDATIRVALAGLTYLLARRLAPSLPPAAAWATGLAVVPLGQPGRPDELAMCFGVAGLLPLVDGPTSVRRLVPAGVLLGLAGSTSPAAGVVFALVQAVCLVGAGGRRLRGAGQLLVSGLAAAATVAIVWGPLLLAHPGAYRQFLCHASIFWERDLPGSILAANKFAWSYGKYRLLSTAGLAGMVVPALVWGRRLPFVRLWLGAWAGVVVAQFLARYTYLWFTGPLFLAAGTATVHELRPRFGPRASGLWAAYLGLAVLVGSVPWAFEAYALLTLPAPQSLARNAAEVAARVPPGSVVLTDEYWWALADGRRVYDHRYAAGQALDGVDYLVLGGNGSGTPGRPTMAWLRDDADVRRHFRVACDRLSREPVRLLGVRLSRSAYGFGPLILERVPQGESRHAGE